MHPFQAALLTWLSIPFVLSASDTYETIRSLDAYKSQRACGQACFYYLGAGAEPFDALGVTLGCTQPVLDSCFCRTDVQGAGETYLSTCISSRCTGPGDVTNDIDMATSIYDSYCQAKGYTADKNPASIAATTTTAHENPTGTQSVVTKTVLTSSPTANLGTSNIPSESSMYGLFLIHIMVILLALL